MADKIASPAPRVSGNGDKYSFSLSFQRGEGGTINPYFKFYLKVVFTALCYDQNATITSVYDADLPRYQTIAVKYYSCMSGALHIRPKDACNF